MSTTSNFLRKHSGGSAEELGDRKGTVLHTVCVDGNLRSALAELREDPTLVGRMDELGQYPLHCACANRRLYAFKIVELLVPLSDAVTRADTLGRLPLHIAVENIGPTHDTQGRDIGAREAELKSGHLSFNAPEMVAVLLKAYPVGASTGDMEQNLPLHLALRSPVVCHRTVQLLLDAYPGALRVPRARFSPDREWEEVTHQPMFGEMASNLISQFPDGQMEDGKHDISSADAEHQLQVLRDTGV